MLNTLVNSTDAGFCNYSTYIKPQIVDEIFECIETVQCQTDMNTEALEQIHDNLQTTNVSATNVSADSICTNSICTNAVSSNGIEATNIQSQYLNVACKATVGSLESNGVIKAESVQTQSISTENIAGLQSLTVEGGVWADNVRTDALEVNGKICAECVKVAQVSTEQLESGIISASGIGADSVVSDCFFGQEANIQKATVGLLSTSNFSSDEIATSKISSTSLSVPKLETSGGITGKGVIDTTSPVWKEIRIPLFTGMIQFYTDEWKVTINGGREFIWEDESLDHLKFLSNDGETVTVAVDWDGEVYYTYDTAKTAPVLSLVDNTGHTPDDDHTYIMQDSGVLRGTVIIYNDKAFTNQGLTILGNLRASNLEITCGESIDCLSIENLYVGNVLRSDNPIEVDICARSFCIASPCTYITDCLYTECICSDYVSSDYVYGNKIDYGTIYAKAYNECCPRPVLSYCEGVLSTASNVCVNSDTVWSDKTCADTYYGDELNVKCANVDNTLRARDAITTTSCSEDTTTDRLSVNHCAKFNGPAYFYDNIYQCGSAYCTHAQNIYTCSDTITMREGADFAGEAQIRVLKYDGTNNGVIQLGTDGTLRIGDEANCQPVLTRSEAGNLADGHVLVWDATNKCAKDGGESIVTCAYVNCIGQECKTAACTYATSVGSECKTAACTYASCIGFECKSDSCSFAVSCGHNIGTSCKTASCTYATSLGTECKTAACNYATSVGTECKNASCAFAVSCGHLIGTSCKGAACSFAVSCGHLIGTSCKGVTCSFTATCGHEIGTSCKNDACTYANTVAGQCKTAACTYANTVAFCNINTCKGIGVMGVARGIDAQCWKKGGYWAYMTTKEGANCCWNHVIKTDWSADTDIWTSAISIPTYNSPQFGIHYKTGCCNGTSGWTLVPNITCVQNLGLACRNIAQSCACSFAAACAQAVVPETSTFARCYGNSTNCIASSNQIKVTAQSGNTFYKIPFTGTTGTTTSDQSLYMDSANAFPSYNPSTNTGCHYTLCVAQTLAVRNANGGFRLGAYCIYIG